MPFKLNPNDSRDVQLLAISFAFPPLASPRSTQVARLLGNLSATTVLICGDEAGAIKDSSIDPAAENRLEACVRVPYVSSTVSKLIDRLSRRAYSPLWNRRNMAPDRYFTWLPSAVEAASTILTDKSFSPSVLATFGAPFTCHLVGLELKRKYNFPWMAHFSDPWADNPFKESDFRTKKINLEFEKQVIETADLLVFTSSETVDLVFDKYSNELRQKTRIVPHCFDPTRFQSRTETNHPKLIIRYLGNFYGQRSPGPLIKTLHRILDRNDELLSNVSFELLGAFPEEVASLNGAQTLPEGLLNFMPYVNYSESLNLMKEADGLIVIDAPAEVSVFLPSKLIDYIGSARPILGLTPPGAAAKLIREIGGIVASPDNVDAMVDSLEEFLVILRARQSSQDSSLQWGNEDVRARYEVARVSGLFRELLDELSEMD